MHATKDKTVYELAATAIAALLLTPAVALAQTDPGEWKCRLCPFEKGYRADVSAGATYVDDDATRFGNGTGYDKEGAYLNVDGEGHYASDGLQMQWYAEDLGLDSRVAEISGGRQGKFDLRLGYRELPYRLFDTTRTVFSASTPDTLSLPSTWVRAPLTSGFTALASSLRKQNIESDRQSLEFGASYLPTSKIDLFADYRRQQRDGVDIVTGSGYTQASFLARPIDHRTDEIDVGARYATGPMNVTLAYYGSFFRNNIDALTWDNPFTSFPGAETERMAREPDNDFQQLSLSGSYRAAALDTLIAFSAALGRGEQNDLLLPYTINPNIMAALPRSSLDGKVDTSNYALTVTSRPTKETRVKLSYRQDERDNQTPQAQWSRVIVDALPSGDSETNLPFGYKRGKLSASGEFQALDTLGVSAGYDRTTLDRDFQEVAEQTENSGWGRLRWKPNPVFDISARGGAAKRDIDRYDTSVAAGFDQNPLMRKYNLAYRYREFGEITVSATPAGKPFSIGVSILYADDSYTKSELGLTDSTETSASADLSWAVSERTSLYLTGSTERLEATQLGSEFGSVADWRATHDDNFYHMGGGFRVAAIADKIDLQLDYTHSEGRTEIDVAGAATVNSRLPDLESKQDSLRLALEYQWSARLDVDFALRYEHLDVSDWALDGVGPRTLPTVLTFGASAFDYDVWAAGLSFRYRIGGGEITFPE
jgi:MtrB/PioB family decaheme-associated outer membrane protein